MNTIKRYHSTQADFQQQLDALLSWSSIADPVVEQRVDQILLAVRTQGDSALLEFTRRFDQSAVHQASHLEISQARLKLALRRIKPDQKAALKAAAKRIQRYHKRQLQKDWSFTETDGTVLGQKISPLQRVGVYVPGGKAAYPSTILMTVIPAKVAGVSEIIMVTPASQGNLNEMVLAAAAIAGVDRVFALGGAQAVAALAYGTETVPKVDKIVGPGNIYVAAAKRKVFGEVAIDMVAGPSEILVISDGKTDPDWVALDLLSQAEHDEMAQAILISPDKNFLDRVQGSIERILPTLERETIARQSLESRAAFIEVESLEQATEISNRIAPEHLELSVENPETLLPLIKHAGAIFMGKYTSEAIGDYVAGPSHVLPTSGTARFSSPLGVYDFQKRSSLIQCSAQSASSLGQLASVLARSESLTAHARSAEARIKK